MSRLYLIKKYARVWQTAPWVERLMFKQQEMHFMWNSSHAYDGGAFNRQLGRWTERSVPKNKGGDLWNHYHPEHEKMDREEARLFELTKHLPDKGVGRLVYNKYEKNYRSNNVDLLQPTTTDGDVYPETFWVRLINLKYLIIN